MYEQDQLLNNCFMLTDFATQRSSLCQVMSALISISTRLLLINKRHSGFVWSTLIQVLVIMMKIIENCSSWYKLFCVDEWFSRILFSNCQSPLRFSKTYCENFIFIQRLIEWPTFLTGSIMKRIIGSLRIRWSTSLNPLFNAVFCSSEGQILHLYLSVCLCVCVLGKKAKQKLSCRQMDWKDVNKLETYYLYTR